MVLLWVCYGFSRVLLWHSFALVSVTVLLSRCYDLALVLLLFYKGNAVDVLGCGYLFSTALLWLYFGFDMALVVAMILRWLCVGFRSAVLLLFLVGMVLLFVLLCFDLVLL